MRKKFKLNAEFLLPEDFQGNFLDALVLYTDYMKNSHNHTIKYPAHLPDNSHFPYTLEKGGKAFSTFSIRSFAFEELGDDIELDQDDQESLEEKLCSELDQ